MDADTSTENVIYDKEKKLWVCSKCSRMFKEKFDLSRHLNKKTPCVKMSTIPNYECYKCLKSFDDKKDYRRHLERKTDCSLDMNAPVNTTHHPIKIDWEVKYKELEAKLKFQEELNEKQKQVNTEQCARQEEIVASISKMSDENIQVYVEYLLNPKEEIKLHHVVHYIFNILLQRQEKEYKLRYVYWFLLDRTSISFLSSIRNHIQNLENEKNMFIKFTEEYITKLDEMKKQQKTLYGKPIFLYLDHLKIFVQTL